MATNSKIEWTDATWNPVTGCSKVSDGCKNCYAERLAHRFGWTTKPWTAANATENVILNLDRLEQPLRWKKPRRIFVNSMSDLFHEQVPDWFIRKVFQVMAEANWHIFQVLTKRPKRMKEMIERLEPEFDGMVFNGTKVSWPLPNVWLGVSVENQKAADERIPLLLQTPAAVRFLSCEPLLGPVDLSGFKPFDGECFCQESIDGCKPRLAKGCPETAIDWVIVGGESGPGARPMHPDWVRSIRDQCQEAGVPFFFKQWGSWFPLGQKSNGWNGISKHRNDEWPFQPMYRIGKQLAGRLLDGREWNEMPEVKFDATG